MQDALCEVKASVGLFVQKRAADDEGGVQRLQESLSILFLRLALRVDLNHQWPKQATIAGAVER